MTSLPVSDKAPYGKDFANLFVRHLRDKSLFWRRGGMGSRSDGLCFNRKIEIFSYGLIEEGQLQSSLKEFATEEMFINWFSAQSDQLIREWVQAQFNEPTFICREAMEQFISEPSAKDLILSDLNTLEDVEIFGKLLAVAVAKNLRLQSYPFMDESPSEGMGFDNANNSFIYGRFQKGKVVEKVCEFQDETSFVDWLSAQTYRSMCELAFDTWRAGSLVTKSSLEEFASTPLNFRKPNL
jgi:hypothetical protein